MRLPITRVRVIGLVRMSYHGAALIVGLSKPYAKLTELFVGMGLTKCDESDLQGFAFFDSLAVGRDVNIRLLEISTSVCLKRGATSSHSPLVNG